MTQSEAQPPLLRLVLTEGPQAGKELDSKKGTSLRVGRTAKSALYIKDPTISEAHAEVAWRDGAWSIRDLGSSNGTALNGRDLEEGAWAPLKDGDVLRLGTTTVARVEVAAVASEQLTVEEFVLAECSQLEQRIRWVAGRGLGCLRRRCRQSAQPPSRMREAARRQPPPAAAAQRTYCPSALFQQPAKPAQHAAHGPTAVQRIRTDHRSPPCPLSPAVQGAGGAGGQPAAAGVARAEADAADGMNLNS